MQDYRGRKPSEVGREEEYESIVDGPSRRCLGGYGGEEKRWDEEDSGVNGDRVGFVPADNLVCDLSTDASDHEPRDREEGTTY